MYNKIFNKNDKQYDIPGHENKLIWNNELGIGFVPSNGYEYGDAYWTNYCNLSACEFSKQLTALRAYFVGSNGGKFEEVCDIGVGSGQFVDSVKCKGSDVNPLAIAWLKEHGYFAEDVTNFKTLTMWDVIEHIEDPSSVIQHADHIFLSTPIYADVEACLKSKHLKPGEHIWYFTDAGVKHFMLLLGFELVDQSDFETVLGRESILSYYFKKAK